MHRHLPALVFLLGSTLPAQTAPCEAFNDQNTNVPMASTPFGFAGATTWGYQFTPTVTVPARAVRLFTGNTSTAGNFMIAEIWSEDPATNLPGSRMAGGTWAISQPLGNAWQGTNLDAVAVLQQGTPYWLVWVEPGFSQVPTEPGGTTGAVARLQATGWTPLQPDAIKLRIYCAPLDGTNTSVNGQPCVTGTSSIGTLFTNQDPAVGNADYALEGTGFPPGALTFLVFGIDPSFASISLPGFGAGCMQHTDAVAIVAGSTGTGNVRAPTAVGHVEFPLAIPGSPSLAGAFFGAQLGVLDSMSTATIPFAVSNGLRFTLF